MNGKMKMIVLAGVAVVSLAGSFFVTRLMTPPQAPQQAQGQTPGQQAGEPVNVYETPADGPRLREIQLEELISQVAAQKEMLRSRQDQLDQQERRLAIAQADLEKQTAELENLRLALVGPLTQLKEAQAKLASLQVTISRNEQENLKRMAAIYEKMDSAAGGEILASMCANNQLDNAVKILSMMSERSAAKMLGEMPDKDLAAQLVERMKRLGQES